MIYVGKIGNGNTRTGNHICNSKSIIFPKFLAQNQLQYSHLYISISLRNIYAATGTDKRCELHRVFQRDLYNVIPNFTVWRVFRKRLHLKAQGVEHL
jgi:hypothetical protein